MPSGASKEKTEYLQQTARQLIADSGIELGHVSQEDHPAHLRKMKELQRLLREKTACTYDTAKKYIAWAMRRGRHDLVVARGGARPGAGAKVKETTPDKFAAWTTTNYDEAPYFLIATAPSRKILTERVEAYFAKPNRFAQFEYSNKREGTLRQFEQALAKQQKHMFTLKNHP